MPYADINGTNIYYEDYGSGPTVILTPGGRVDTNGLRPMAALISAHCRVIIHDRRNCGRSDVNISGDLSEQHIWAEEMAGLLQQLDTGPVFAAGGSAGSRTSMTLAARHPELVSGLFIWEVSGGPRSAEIMSPGYYGQYIEAAANGGMEAVCDTDFFTQRIKDNPNNKTRLLSMEVETFVSVMQRWQDSFSRPNPIGDLTESEVKSIHCPTFIFAGNVPDEVHHISAAENANRLISDSEIRPSAWTNEEWQIIGQHDDTFPGIAATNRYHMKATVYASDLLDFISRCK